MFPSKSCNNYIIFILHCQDSNSQYYCPRYSRFEITYPSEIETNSFGFNFEILQLSCIKVKTGYLYSGTQGKTELFSREGQIFPGGVEF